MIFASPVSENYLDGSYYDDAGRPFYLSEAKLAADYSPVRFCREIRLFRKFCGNGRVLDVGCSTGAFLYQLSRQCPGAYDVVGTDVSSPALQYAKAQGVNIDSESFLCNRWDANEFDAVTFWAVLEHVAEPRLFLQQAFRILKPGGLCFVLVPNFRSFAVRLLGAKYRYILPQHINYFTNKTLRAIGNGILEPIHSTTMHFNPAVIAKDVVGGGQPATDADRVTLLTRTTALKENPLLFPLRLVYRQAENVLRLGGLADNCVAVFRKLS